MLGCFSSLSLVSSPADLPSWAIGPFSQPQRILHDRPAVTFTCPVTGDVVEWAAKDVFNPGAVVKDGLVHLLLRAEDNVGRYAGVSRLGLATSSDGHHFELEPEPVLYPDNGRWQSWEWPGGVEDPRLVESPDGGYVVTYTAFDGKVGALFVATSDDLRTWTKHGPAFADTKYVRMHTKAGAILTELKDGRLVAARHSDGKFWMYWGEGHIYGATSDDLIRWTPVELDIRPERYLSFDPGVEGGAGWGSHKFQGVMGLRSLAGPRRGRWDSLLVEPGPPAIRTADGIVLLHNGANHFMDHDPAFPPMSYQPSQLLFDSEDPTAVVARLQQPFLGIDPSEADGQVGNVVFIEGLVAFKGEWHLYVGLADSRLGHSTAPL